MRDSDYQPKFSLWRLRDQMAPCSVMVHTHFDRVIMAVLNDKKDDGQKCDAVAEAVGQALNNNFAGLENLSSAAAFSPREQQAIRNLSAALVLSS